VLGLRSNLWYVFEANSLTVDRLGDYESACQKGQSQIIKACRHMSCGLNDNNNKLKIQ